MASEPEEYLAVLKAAYDYEPQPDAEEELAITENQLLLLLERTDEEYVSLSPASPRRPYPDTTSASWWKVKVKTESQDEDGASGLVPSAYVEPVS